jgi:thiol-disulfide isomerase/thioredoxin
MASDRSAQLTRRALVAGAFVGAAAPAVAQRAAPQPWPLPRAAAGHAAFAPWTRPSRRRRLALDVPVVTDSGAPITLRAWLDRRPTLLVIWAAWCAPCLRESPDLARLSARLENADARLAIRALQAFDATPADQARRTLARLEAGGLVGARASRSAERLLLDIFGPTRESRSRIPLPAMLLIGPDGAELARHTGLIEGAGGGYTYWRDAATFDFLMTFGRV